MNKYKPGTTAYKNDYNKRNYKQLKVNVKPELYNNIENFCKIKGITKAEFIVNCCKYCIDNDIDIFDKR